jgi:hypothetical protein
MAVRIETRIGAILILLAAAASAQTASVRHRHLHGGGSGDLQISEEGISFTEAKKEGHSRTWKFEDLQQIELSLGTLRILTYEDQKWKLGRDGEYVFDRLPVGFASKAYGQWRDRLDQRFIAGLPDKDVATLWEIPAKMSRRSQGVLRMSADRIVYQAEKPGQSRTWRFADIENVASAGPFDLSVVTWEKRGVWNSGAREFRFQLKQGLSEARYNDLWRKLSLSRQSEYIQNSMQPMQHK